MDGRTDRHIKACTNKWMDALDALLLVMLLLALLHVNYVQLTTPALLAVMLS